MVRRAVLLAVLLAACGGGGGDSPKPTVSALAERIGCDRVEPAPPPMELGATEEATCTLDGGEVTILTYKSNEPRDVAQGIADQFGGEWAVLGDRFTLRVSDRAMAERLRDAVGGEVR